MDDAARQQASDLLYEAWMKGEVIEDLPYSIRPQTRAEGYGVQGLLDKRFAAPLWGWKIAATSIAGQKHIGVDGPLAGRIFAERVLQPGATVPASANRMKVAEVEFAFRFSRDLSPRDKAYSVEEVLAAVGSLHVG
ncbi:MAG: hydratase, partial [Rhodoblastus sp.]|nr:hydratase [Rhodoblastus sp.]